MPILSKAEGEAYGRNIRDMSEEEFLKEMEKNRLIIERYKDPMFNAGITLRHRMEAGEKFTILMARDWDLKQIAKAKEDLHDAVNSGSENNESEVDATTPSEQYSL